MERPCFLRWNSRRACWVFVSAASAFRTNMQFNGKFHKTISVKIDRNQIASLHLCRCSIYRAHRHFNRLTPPPHRFAIVYFYMAMAQIHWISFFYWFGCWMLAFQFACCSVDALACVSRDIDSIKINFGIDLSFGCLARTIKFIVRLRFNEQMLFAFIVAAILPNRTCVCVCLVRPNIAFVCFSILVNIKSCAAIKSMWSGNCESQRQSRKWHRWMRQHLFSSSSFRVCFCLFVRLLLLLLFACLWNTANVKNCYQTHFYWPIFIFISLHVFRVRFHTDFDFSRWACGWSETRARVKEKTDFFLLDFRSTSRNMLCST